ncbi:MAG: ThuA domain-containing protein [Chitinophagaceae bacterium]
MITFKRSFAALAVLQLFAVLVFSAHLYAKPPKKVLVFSKTVKFRHTDGIRAGKLALMRLGKENYFDVDTTENADVFTPENLKKYSAIVFLNTTGDILNDQQQGVFEQYIRSGKGFVGIHSATDTEYDWPWYGKLVGAYFGSHPPGQQAAAFVVVDANNISTRGLPPVWKKKDELYNFKWISDQLHVLIKIDENSYTGGKNGEHHPMSWFHEYEGGRSFYTAMGHDAASYSEALYLQHVLGGIKYALGMKPTDKLKITKSTD